MDSPASQQVGLPPHYGAMGTTTMNHGATGSAESSPKSSHQADWDEPLAPLPGAKLRLMCSYGGHIIPRPHDKTLCYVGGETRMVVVERSSTLTDLTGRLSKTLLDGRQFTLKYQLPNEELDSLISVTTDEDLENMIEEYDRIMAANSPLKPASGRLRLFLFFVKPETAVTMGALLDDAKSENWFVDALNGVNLPRGLSDSAAMDDLLSLDSGTTEPGAAQLNPAVVCSDASVQQSKIAQQDIQSIQSVMPDSPMIETTSPSFDSSTSSPSMAHLPPIRVRVDEAGGTSRLPEGSVKGGSSLDEHFSSQLRVTPPLPTAILTPSAVAVTHAPATGYELNNHSNRVISDDERSDQGAAVASRKPPLPLPLQPGQQRISGGLNLPSPDSKHAGGYNLPSPDSVKSDSSMTSAQSFSKVPANQDDVQVALRENKPPTTVVNTEQRADNRAPSPPHSNGLSQQMHNPSPYLYPPPQEQDQHQHPYIQQNMHYISAHTQIPPYYQVYATQQPVQAQVDHQHSQYPVYILPVPQTQQYNLPVQSADPTTMPSAVQPSSAAQVHPSAYPTRSATPYNNPTGMVQVAPNTSQYQQYVGQYTPGSAQPMLGNPATYGNYDYSRDNHQQQHQLHHQMYYTAQLASVSAAANAAVPVAASQYQSITPAQAAMIAEASMQMPTTDGSNQPPRTS